MNRFRVLNSKLASESVQILDEKFQAANSAVNFEFTDADYGTAMEKIDNIAKHHDVNDPRSPSLKPFQGSKMTPSEFRQMIGVTFNIAFTDKELGALVATFEHDDRKGSTPSRSDRPSLSRSFSVSFASDQSDEDIPTKSTLSSMRRSKSSIRGSFDIDGLIDKIDEDNDEMGANFDENNDTTSDTKRNAKKLIEMMNELETADDNISKKQGTVEIPSLDFGGSGSTKKSLNSRSMGGLSFASDSKTNTQRSGTAASSRAAKNALRCISAIKFVQYFSDCPSFLEPWSPPRLLSNCTFVSGSGENRYNMYIMYC